ncbi:MAG: class I SAM-dependent RNA methyltransferase, partial [Ignavibacteriae bacterium]|nr:class I SAM-dependent RNA methyltransferase [Ignavibacteriota bacterium]
PFYSFKAQNPDQLYKKVKEYNWEELIQIDDTFAVDGVVNSEFFTHSKYAALKVKDSIVDRIREDKGKRPNIDIKNPTIRVNVHIEQNNCSLLLDSSGDSLHKRGYRVKGGEAPLNEVLAAGMILLSEWDKNSNFVDPMCGSGTLAIEAALLANNIAPNINRKHFGFMNWKDFDQNLFQNVKAKLINEQINFEYEINANDLSSKMIDIAKSNAITCDIYNKIKFSVNDFKNFEHNLSSGILITNPPYDERIKLDDIKTFYKEFGDTLKKNFTGFDVWILSANAEALKSIGLRTSRRLHLYNGPLESRFYNYQMYHGSKKNKYEKD